MCRKSRDTGEGRGEETESAYLIAALRRLLHELKEDFSSNLITSSVSVPDQLEGVRNSLLSALAHLRVSRDVLEALDSDGIVFFRFKLRHHDHRPGKLI